MIDPCLRWLGLGAAAFLVGCSSPPAPIVNVTVIMPPAKAEPPQRSNTGFGEGPAINHPIEATLQSDWPQSAWRVFSKGHIVGPPLEHIEQCYDLALIEQQKPDSIGPAQCHWVAVPRHEQVHDVRM